MMIMERLPIHEYYRRAAEGLPEMQALLDELIEAIGRKENLKACLRDNQKCNCDRIRQNLESLKSDARVIDAFATAAAIVSVSENQLFEDVVHRQFDGHDVCNVINGIFSSHTLLSRVTATREKIKKLYADIHLYMDRYMEGDSL